MRPIAPFSTAPQYERPTRAMARMAALVRLLPVAAGLWILLASQSYAHASLAEMIELAKGALNLGDDAQPTTFSAFLRYVIIGFQHIVPEGWDHMLFVLGLFFLSTKMKPLLWQVSAFTLAHTVTLALSTLGYVTVPSSIVEPLIALSITYVAVENIFSDQMTRWRPMIVFGFGLLHGLGFASALGEFGLPEDSLFLTLIGFNVGVEFGQLAVIAAAYVFIAFPFGTEKWYRRAISVPVSIIIAGIGAYWFVQRTVILM